MSHYAFRESGDDFELQVDYIVIGTGAGGATAAVSLAREGASVAAIEAGAWRDPRDYPSSAYGGMRDLMPEMGSTVAWGKAQWPIVQGRAVGGSTVINSAICVRTPGDVLDDWEKDHGVGGIGEKLWHYQDQLETELSASISPMATLGRMNELAIAGADNVGYENHRTKRFVTDCAGSGQCLQGCRLAKKQSLNLNFMPEVLKLGGTVLSCAPVKRVLLEGNRAVGVTGVFEHPQTRRKGAKFTVRAKKGVILAASCTRSPVLLMNSGIKHKRMGHGFRAHPGTGIYGWYDDPVDMNTGATQGWASTAFRNSEGFKLETLSLPIELVVSRISGGGTELTRRMQGFRNLAMWVMAVRAEAEGRVRSVFGQPFIQYGFGPADMARMRNGAVMLAKTHFAAGARWVLPGIYGMPWRIGPDQVALMEEASLDPRHWIAILSHLFGGCTMGADPARAVCDPRGRVYGYEGLVIGDASQIPTTLGVNPQHTIMALARLRAHQMLEDNS